MRGWALLVVLAACSSDKEGDTGSVLTSDTTTPTGSTPTGGTSGGGTPTGTTTTPTGTTSTGTTSTGTTPTGTTDTGPIDTGTPPEPNEASCAQAAGPMRVDCSAALTEAGPATLELSAPGVPTRTFQHDEVASEHAFVGWGLKPATEYTWSLAGQSGTVWTSPIPFELEAVDIAVEGTLFGMDAMLVYVACGWFLMIDGDGDIVWAEPTDVYNGLPDGMAWSQPDRTLLSVRDSVMSPDVSVFSEVSVSGEEVLRLEPDVHFSLRLTHDVARWGPYTYLLGEDGDGIGGFEVWNGFEKLGVYSLATDFGEVDRLFTDHINGITVSDEGEALLSVFGFDAVVAVDGDPASPTFLQLAWHASGSPGGPDDLPDPTYVPEDGELFRKQHNASRHGDELWLMDNSSTPNARALRLGLDPSGVLEVREVWDLARRCPNQGGAIPVPGGILTTCANQRTALLFRDGAAEPEFTLTAECLPSAPLEGFTRAFPVIIE